MSSQRWTAGPSGKVLLADLGVSLPGVLRRAALPSAVYATGTAELTTAEYYAFWRALDDEAADPLLPIHIGGALSPEVFDPPLFAGFCSPDLIVAATRIAHYKKLIGPLRLVVDSAAGTTRIETHWPEGPRPPDALVLMELIFWVALARIATRTPVHPLRFAAPVHTDQATAYRTYLGTPLEHAAVPSVTFSQADATRPFLTANDRMWQYFEPGLRTRLTELDTDPTTTDLVREKLLRLLPAGTATIDAVARDLGISARTLQRRLTHESTSFQSVLRQTRETLARHYLSQPNLKAADIAYLLGYDDTNSFYRAFHTWTGQTPDQATRNPAASHPGPR